WIQSNIIYERKKDNEENIEKELKYFLGNQLNLTLSSPQIYVSIVDIIVLKNRNELIPLLLECKFEAHNVFYSYTSPRILYSLIDLAYKSEEGFLLFLILMIRCAKTCTNDLLGYVLRSYRGINTKEEKTIKHKKNCQGVILFWKLLNFSENIEQFKEKVSELLVYNEKYDHFYETLFVEYKLREQNICRNRVIKGIEYFEKFGSGEKDS
ncbi:MAG: hypothetical protein Q4C57_10280, partial [Bacillota bacterium]|nr:hypothetical protein [Bacillota bacterium]